MATISQNQYQYLQNLLAKGGGNAEWAKAQLKGAVVEEAPPTPVKEISENQYKYLNNLIAKGGGNAEWAKAQLKGATVKKPTKPVVATTETPVAPTLVQTPTTMVSYTPASTPIVNTPSLQDQLLNAKRQQRLAELENAMKRSLGQLDVEKGSVTPLYAGAKSQARTESKLSAEDFAKFLQTKGLGGSGAASQGEIASNVALQGRIGQLSAAEQKDLADIERRRSGIISDTEFAKQSAGTEFDLLGLQTKIEEEARAAELARAEALRTEEQGRADFGTSIMANYNDLSAYKDRLVSQGAPQWQIDQVEAMRQEKIRNLNLDPATGRPLPVDNSGQVWDMAMSKWNAGIPLTQQEMQVIGSPYSVKPKTSSGGSSGPTVTQDRNYAMDLWKALGKANETVSQILGIPIGTVYSGQTTPPPVVDIKPYEDYIDTYYKTTDSGVSSLDKNGVAMYLVQLDKNGLEDEATQLAIKYGISAEVLELAERILGNRR